ncbi:MAG: hypothetical protein AAF236_15530 [Verrucomicrobiota bacterium]
MNQRAKLIRHPLLAILGLSAVITNLQGGFGSISEEDFGKNRTIVFALSTVVESNVSARVVKRNGPEASETSEGAVVITAEIFEAYIDSKRRAIGPNLEKLIEKYGVENLPDDELKIAESDDEKWRERNREALESEYERVGLSWDPDTEYIEHSFSGKARMTILEVFEGTVETGSEIEVVWEKIRFRWSCPTILPFDGECGWIFEDPIEPGTKMPLGRGFHGSKDARKALAAYRSKGTSDRGSVGATEEGRD